MYLSFHGRNVGKNNLTGLVPSGLLERSKTGSLSLRYPHNQSYINSHYIQENDRFSMSICFLPVMLIIISSAKIIEFPSS